MKYFYYSIQVMLLVLVLLACKKLSNDGLDEAPVVLKAPLEISVVNDDDQLPVVGVKVIVKQLQAEPLPEWIPFVQTRRERLVTALLIPII
jgi:hypothetical protein